MQDSQGRVIEYARISLTEACNFCCTYCRPHEITEAMAPVLPASFWMSVLEALWLGGVKAVRFTGGEPLLYPHLYELLEAVQKKEWFSDISMTTNGSLLSQQAEKLYAAGVRRLNISLDSVEEEGFAQAVGRSGQLERVLQGIEAAKTAGFKNIKINTVVQKPMSDEEVRVLLHYGDTWNVVWRFIEYMPFQGKQSHVPTFQEWKAQLERIVGAPLELVTDRLGFGPAQYFRLPSGQQIGFIFPLSNQYCSSCNRIRFTADGYLRLCLLRDEDLELKRMVQRGADAETIMHCIEEALQGRYASHDGEAIEKVERPMWRIGG